MQKHGIVLGPDLSINGDVDVAEADESSSVDPASQPAQESQTTPAEGNSMLGKTHCGIKNFLPSYCMALHTTDARVSFQNSNDEIEHVFLLLESDLSDFGGNSSIPSFMRYISLRL